MISKIKALFVDEKGHETELKRRLTRLIYKKREVNKFDVVTGEFSFIIPEEKYVFADVTRAWIKIYFLTAFTVITYSLYLDYSTAMLNSKKNEFIADKIKLTKTMDEKTKKLAVFKRRDEIVGNVMDSNASLQDSIIRFFNLVPEQILLTDMLIEKDSLVLKGVTPSKEIYTNLLETPLRSIFNVTKVDFYKTLNTWTNFVSVNKKGKQKKTLSHRNISKEN